MLRFLRLAQPRLDRSVAADDELLPLAEAAAGDDPVALRTLLTLLGPHLLRVVRRVVGSEHPDVEDIVQECAVELVAALRRFRRESSVQHFACRVALQTAMNARRKMRAHKRLIPAEECIDADSVAGAEMTPERRAASRASVELIRELCDSIPPAQAEVLALHCVLGYTMNEIAAICEAPLETVRSRFRAAKLSLMSRAQADPRLRELVEEMG